MPLSERTIREKVYLSILAKCGPLSTKELAKEAQQNPNFRSMKLVALEKDTLRFAQHYEALGTLMRRDAKLHWLPFETKTAIVRPETQDPTFLLNTDGFLTSRAAVKCVHCGFTIDLSKVKIEWRLKSRIIQLALHVHHFIRVTCPNCGWLGRYDTYSDVRPLLSDSP